MMLTTIFILQCYIHNEDQTIVLYEDHTLLRSLIRILDLTDCSVSTFIGGFNFTEI